MLPKSGGMAGQTNPIDRVVAAARFFLYCRGRFVTGFAPRLGAVIVGMRCRASSDASPLAKASRTT